MQFLNVLYNTRNIYTKVLCNKKKSLIATIWLKTTMNEFWKNNTIFLLGRSKRTNKFFCVLERKTNPEGRCTCRSAARKVFRLHKSHQLESRGCWITSIVTGCRQSLQRSCCNVNDAASFFGPVNCYLRRKTRFRKCPYHF